MAKSVITIPATKSKYTATPLSCSPTRANPWVPVSSDPSLVSCAPPTS